MSGPRDNFGIALFVLLGSVFVGVPFLWAFVGLLLAMWRELLAVWRDIYYSVLRWFV